MAQVLENSKVIEQFRAIVGSKYVITNSAKKIPYSKGYRYGSGEVLAVIKPESLLEIWKVLQLCVDADIIVIMQAANTGLTGGSTPYGRGYDRPIVAINTMRIDDIHIIDEGKQIVALAGSTLFDLENKLAPYKREPHSVIGSTSIGATIVGGVCNNSGGSLIQRGPAYTELALYAKIDKKGKLLLVNDLGIELGETPEEILINLQQKKYSENQVKFPEKLASDNEYQERLRSIDEDTPARFNSDKRRLHAASGSAGKVVVFAVRVDTYPAAEHYKVFYVGTNDPDVLTKMRRDILSQFKNLPVTGDYLHRACYDATKKYSKDNFIVIHKLGTQFIPKLFALKRRVDLIAGRFKFLPNKFSDRLMQFLSNFWPNHLPRRMEEYRDLYEHHWVIETADEAIDEARAYFEEFFSEHEGAFFECTEKEGEKALLHRFVAGSAIGRYHAIHEQQVGPMMSIDVAFPRNESDWFEKLPPEIDDLFEIKLHYGHFFCQVFHQNYIVKKGVDAKVLKNQLLKTFDARGAEYPAEHNVGHEYVAKPVLREFYKELDPTNGLNPGIGQTSKKKHWK
ncbi:MAG: D-lactate dehydrogenase [Bacteroidota bacterium]